MAAGRDRRRWLARVARAAGAQLAGTAGIALSMQSSRAAAPGDGLRFSFVLVGDTPYTTLETRQLGAMMKQWSARHAFAIHVGDLKSGAERCDDALLIRRRDLLAASPIPLVSVPGDNDWLDCSRTAAGAYDPGERLARLRALLHSQPRSLGARTIAVERQRTPRSPHGLPENQRWLHEGTLFATVNLPGGWGRFVRDRAHDTLRAAIEAANERWVRESFAMARRGAIDRVALAAHADPGFEHDPGAPWSWRGLREDGYQEFRALLREMMAQYDGHVLFMHGDTHVFRDDRPLVDERGERVDRFTRVECFGSPFGTSWVEISVRDDALGPFFVATRRLEDMSAR